MPSISSHGGAIQPSAKPQQRAAGAAATSSFKLVEKAVGQSGMLPIAHNSMFPKKEAQTKYFETAIGRMRDDLVDFFDDDSSSGLKDAAEVGSGESSEIPSYLPYDKDYRLLRLLSLSDGAVSAQSAASATSVQSASAERKPTAASLPLLHARIEDIQTRLAGADAGAEFKAAATSVKQKPTFMTKSNLLMSLRHRLAGNNDQLKFALPGDNTEKHKKLSFKFSFDKNTEQLSLKVSKGYFRVKKTPVEDVLGSGKGIKELAKLMTRDHLEALLDKKNEGSAAYKVFNWRPAGDGNSVSLLDAVIKAKVNIFDPIPAEYMSGDNS